MKSAYFSYISALLLFGSNGIIASLIDLSSNEIVLYRTFIGSLLLFIFFVASKNNWTFYHYKKDFFYLSLSGISMGLSWMFLYAAYSNIGVSISSLLYYCGPIIVMLLSPLLFKEKLTIQKVSVLGYLEPLSAVILSVILLNESMTFVQILGAILVLGGALYAELGPCRY